MELTPREREILARVIDGQATKTIAEHLGVSQQAVKAHLTRLFERFGVSNRAGLVAAALTARGAEDLATERAQSDRRQARMNALTDDLARDNRDLSRSNEELRSDNADLRASNARLRGDNERLRDPGREARGRSG